MYTQDQVNSFIDSLDSNVIKVSVAEIRKDPEELIPICRFLIKQQKMGKAAIYNLVSGNSAFVELKTMVRRYDLDPDTKRMVKSYDSVLNWNSRLESLYDPSHKQGFHNALMAEKMLMIEKNKQRLSTQEKAEKKRRQAYKATVKEERKSLFEKVSSMKIDKKIGQKFWIKVKDRSFVPVRGYTLENGLTIHKSGSACWSLTHGHSGLNIWDFDTLGECLGLAKLIKMSGIKTTGEFSAKSLKQIGDIVFFAHDEYKAVPECLKQDTKAVV